MDREFDASRHERVESVRASEVGHVRKIVAEGIQTLAHGALACPACLLPLWPEGAIPVETELACPFCSHGGRARDFLVRDVYDTAMNEVYLIARLA